MVNSNEKGPCLIVDTIDGGSWWMDSINFGLYEVAVILPMIVHLSVLYLFFPSSLKSNHG